MRTHLKTIVLGAILCLGLVAAAKLLRVEIFVFDPDDQFFDFNVTLTVTAYDQAGHVLGTGDYVATPDGPKPHVRLDLPIQTDYLRVDVFDADDNCSQVFDNVQVGGRARVGGQGVTLVLSQCEGAVR